MTYLSDIATWLQEQGFGTYAPTDDSDATIYTNPGVDYLTGPDETIALVDRQGTVAQYFQQLTGRPNLLVTYRGGPNDPDGAMDVAWALWRAFGGVANTVMGDTYVASLSPTSTPYWFSTDSSNRTVYSIPLQVFLDG